MENLPKFIEKNCKHHGLTNYVLEGRGYYRCKKCRSEAVHERRKEVKRLAAEYKGGGCFICGYNRCVEALDFHHIDPNQKDFSIASGGKTVGWKTIKKEIDKCVLLCANCHREFHAGLIQIENLLCGSK